MLANHRVHVSRREMLEARPAVIPVRSPRSRVVVLTLRKQSPLDGRLETRGFQLFECLQLIKAFDEKQIGYLLDNFQRIRNSTGPKRIPDLIYLATNLVCQHSC